ncbi:MAG: tetratricopeptide repeat protein, partial [Pirellulales bacterium]|nr:tetratricopeptide repeat protein [Pirellulales bacterium]
RGAKFTFADYRRLYADAQAELLAKRALGSTEYPDSVMTTWQITNQRLTAEARALLRLCSYLAATPIPLSLLIGGVETIRAEAAELAGLEAPPAGHAELWVNDRVDELTSYSMAQSDGRALSFHPLVQTVERLQIESPAAAGNTAQGTATAPSSPPPTLQRALNWINGAFAGDPTDVRTWPVLDPLTAHAETIAWHADRAQIAAPTARLMNQVGLLLKEKTQFAAAERLYRRAIVIDEASLASEHPEVATDLNNLAALLQATNRLAEAEPLMRRALEIVEASFGPMHPKVAGRLNNLAQLLKATNRMAEAEPLMRRALKIDEASFGPMHPSVAIRLNNLALLLQATNRLDEAEPLMRRALEIFEARLGSDHPNVATQLNNLATLLKATNHLAEAEPLMRRALKIDEASFGPMHPSVAIRLNNLALLLQATNRLDEAEPLMRRALEIVVHFQQATGHEHPQLAIYKANYAAIAQALGRP